MTTQGRDSALNDFNIRDHSAMSNSDRKNVPAMNLRVVQDQVKVSRFENVTADDYTDLKSRDFDEKFG